VAADELPRLGQETEDLKKGSYVALLNQILGVRKSVNSTAGKTFVELHRNAQKVNLINGITRTYKPKDDEGEQLPGEYQKVQFTVADLNGELVRALTRQYDVNATVDVANTAAKADITFDGITIPDVPVTTLMWLEKQLAELADYIRKLPTLDPAVDWEYDDNAGLFRSAEVTTHRSTKVAKPIVLYPATDKHAAQTQLITEDVITGYWTTQRLSGAMPQGEVKEMLARIETVREAVVAAREKANMTPVSNFSIGETLLDYIFIR